MDSELVKDLEKEELLSLLQPQLYTKEGRHQICYFENITNPLQNKLGASFS